MSHIKLSDLPSSFQHQALSQLAKQVEPEPSRIQSYVIMGDPMGKPRMTRCDKWKKRDCVVRYREWCDNARASTEGRMQNPIRVDFLAYIAMPDSWSEKKRRAMQGQLHRVKADIDNIAKGILDGLLEQDQGVAILCGEKRWDDGKGARVQITLFAEV